MLDVNEMRDPIIAAYGLRNVDETYTFYYDETNNVRKLHLTPGGLNINRPECFVLGGIVHRGPPTEIDLAPLRSAMQLQSNVEEVKLRHIASGGFLDMLRSARLATFLDWLAAEQFLVHYQVTDLLYWSIVDIVDSILAAGDVRELMAVHPMLKDSLYTLLRDDIDGTAELLRRYDYPGVGRDRRAAFVAELLDLIEQREAMLDHFQFYMLKGLLQMARNLDSLPYVEDETPNVLIDGFGAFFANRLYLFKNAQHFLDDEKRIEAYLESLALTDGGRPLRHYRFANSKAEPGVQLSDVVAGLLGKLFSYLNATPAAELEHAMTALSDTQLQNLSRLARLLDRSTDACPAFAQYVISAEDQQRASFVLEHIGLAIPPSATR